VENNYTVENSYTYSQVKKILCEGCRYGIPVVLDCGMFRHKINDISIACRATDFIKKTDGGTRLGCSL